MVKALELHDANWLHTAYITLKLSTRTIARQLGCTRRRLVKALKKHGIKVKDPRHLELPQLQNRAWLEEKYKQLSTNEIAAELGCSAHPVVTAMEKLGIVRTGHPRPLIRSKYKHKAGPDGKLYSEHRLIMEAHLGRKLGPTEHVHHIDGNKRNNELSNLLVIRRERHVSLHFQGKNHPRSRLTEINVREIRQRAEQGETQTSLGQHFGVTQSAIWCILRRKSWKHVT